MRILIAEDGSLSRTLLERSLQRAGYEVIAAEDGARALQELDQEDPPRLALLDWIMPGVDGAEICRELRTRKNKPYTYLILLSSKEWQDIVEGLESGRRRLFDQTLRRRGTKGQVARRTTYPGSRRPPG